MCRKYYRLARFWKRKFVRTKENLSLWYSQHPNRQNIRNYRYVMTRNNTGVLGIEYDEIDQVLPKDEQNDWAAFVKEDSDGLTKTRQKLLQMAIESYVYSILGVQAQTRWSIVGQGGKSLQTQDIFHRLVKDTLIQDDPVKAISNMRTAMLNLVISPGIILIPSSMIILKERIKGFKNVLTLATKNMKFGVNEEINRIPEKKVIKEVKPKDVLQRIKKTEVVYH